MDSSMEAITLLVLLLLFPDGSRSYQEIFTPATVDQPAYTDVGLDVRNSTSITFEVKACSSALVLLMKTPVIEDNDIIEFVIGGWENTRSVIMKHQINFVATIPHTPLDCKEFRPFWISWDSGIYMVGYGLIVGNDSFMSYGSQSTLKVNAVVISTGSTSNGTWLFDDLTCAAGETVKYAYCKSYGAKQRCVVGLGDVKVTKVWPYSIKSGDCRRKNFGFIANRNLVWVKHGCGLIFAVCLVNDCVVSQLQTTFCNTPQEDCLFTNQPTNSNLISVSEVTPSGVCSSLGFIEEPYGFATSAPDIFGYNSDSMFVNGNCSGTFQGCFSRYHNCPSGEISTVTCTSQNSLFGYTACRVGDGDKVIRFAWPVVYSSPTQCNYFNGSYPNQGPGGAWGYHENILWTAEGCGAMFGVCLDFGCPGGQTASLSCSSVGSDDEYQECTLPHVKDYIILYSRHFEVMPGTTCLNEGLGAYDPVIHNSSLGMYGWVYNKLWSKNNCTSMFMVCYKGPCEIRGDPHFISNDGKTFTYSGNCAYQLVSDDAMGFNVVGNFFKCGHSNQASCLSSLNIFYGILTITLQRPGKIEVDGNVIPNHLLPYTTPDGQVHIIAVGGRIRVELPNGVYIMWDRRKKADIYLPITFQGITKGLCGTYDINNDNDFTLPNGQVVNDTKMFGNHWEVPGSC